MPHASALVDDGVFDVGMWPVMSMIGIELVFMMPP